MEVFQTILAFLRSDVFASFGLLTIPFLIGRYIPKLKESFSKIDEIACRLIIFSGVAYTVLLLISLCYSYLFLGEEYQWTSRATGRYAWSFWVTLFSWLCITQPFRFKLVRKNILIRLISIPFFLITIEQYIILITTIHRDYLPPAAASINLKDILTAIPFWPLHLLLKLGLFIGYVFLFQWIYEKIKKNKAVS